MEEQPDPNLLPPSPELRDDVPIDGLDLPTRIKRVLQTEGLKTVGDVREAPDEILLSFPDLGPASVKLLRDMVGLPSSEGVRADNKKSE
jgi:DNA-directed RNA polymerase alpha subunit